ncbi:MAG: hypothetical protein Q7O66_00700, partial [Dehalococcoidia bacterium]|nr:hypothetical protein [Dehalococcoidia bacterium]
DLPADKHHIFDAIAADQQGVRLPFSLLLNSPEMAGRMSPLRKYLFYENSLPPLVKNMAILMAARESDSRFVWSNAAVWCRESGAREEVIDVVGNRLALDLLTEEEALIVRFGREMLCDHRVSDATYDAARARFGDHLLTDLTVTFGFYTMIGHLMNTWDIDPRPDRPMLP